MIALLLSGLRAVNHLQNGETTMFKTNRCFGLSAMALALLVSGTAASAQEVRDLSVVQTQSFNAGNVQSGGLTVLTLLDRASATYGIGEKVRLAVKTNADAYVTVFNVGASGKVTQLFPNAYQTDNHVTGGETVEIPSPESGASFQVGGPVGAELIKVIATSKPVTIFPASRLVKDGGLFFSLDGDAEALNRDLQVVASKPPAETDVAIVNQVIKTVGAPVGASASGGFIVVPAAGAVQPTFPLLLASDKPVYKPGEPVTLGVTALEACHLTVVARDAQNKVTLLYPSAGAGTGTIAPLEPAIVSGAAGSQTVIASSPGTYTVTALCRSTPRLAADGKAAADALDDEERDISDRDLAVVQNRPKHTTAFAKISFNVTK